MIPGTLIASANTVPNSITILFAVLLIGLIACLALEEKLHAKKSIIAAAFAVLCLFLGTLTNVLSFQNVVVGSYQVQPQNRVEVQVLDEQEQNTGQTIIIQPEQETTGKHATTDPTLAPQDVTLHIGGHEIAMPTYIPGIDWSVIAIILGSSLFVDVTSRSGLFSWIAIRVTKLSRGDPLRLLCFYGVMTVLFSAVLNNVTAMIIVGSLTVVSLEKLERRHQLMAFLLIEGLLTNVGGLLTLISSVPNIIVGTTANISFTSFLLKSTPYVVLATTITLIMGAAFFRIKSLKTETEKFEARELVSGFDENDGIGSWVFFKMAAVMLGVFILLIAGTSALPVINKLGMGFVAISMAVIMLLMFRSEVDKFYRAVDWDLIGFFMALFVVIYVMEQAEVLHWIGLALQSVMGDVTLANATSLDATTLLVGAAAFSSVTDNIPLSAMLASILHDLNTPDSSGLWWSVIFGANLGGNITPIGSASTLVAVTIMHKHDVKMSFMGFVKLAILFAIVQLILAIAYVIFIVPLIPSF